MSRAASGAQGLEPGFSPSVARATPAWFSSPVGKTSNTCPGFLLLDSAVRITLAGGCECAPPASPRWGCWDGPSALASPSCAERPACRPWRSNLREPVARHGSDGRVAKVRCFVLFPGEAFEVVQKEVADLLKGRILVGHALHNDLKVPAQAPLT